MSEEQFMEKLYKERKSSEKYEKPGNAITVVLMGVIFICSAPRDIWINTIMSFVFYAVCCFLVTKFVYSVSGPVWEQQRRVLDECREQGITIFEYEQEHHDKKLK